MLLNATNCGSDKCTAELKMLFRTLDCGSAAVQLPLEPTKDHHAPNEEDRRQTQSHQKTTRKAAIAPQPQSTREQLSSIIKSARDLMRKDAGLSGDLDRLPQLSWVLFLKCYDDMEKSNEDKAILKGQKYRSVIPKPFRWRD